jgi:hypothetical protein
MVHKLNDSQPVDIHTAVAITDTQMSELKSFLTDLHTAHTKLAPAVLSDNQFEKLTALLQPGYELSSLMLADHKAMHRTITPGARAPLDAVPAPVGRPLSSPLNPPTPNVVVRDTRPPAPVTPAPVVAQSTPTSFEAIRG